MPAASNDDITLATYCHGQLENEESVGVGSLTFKVDQNTARREPSSRDL
jgi:hypothetical protein